MITPAYAPTATERVLPRMALDFTTGVLDPRVTVTRALNTATRVNSSGFVEVVNANLPRFDYNPATLVPKGLLIEEARTNLFRYSEQLNNTAYWSTSNSTVTSNSIISPSNALDAETITRGASGGEAMVRGATSQAINTTYTISVFAKAGSAGAFLYLRNVADNAALVTLVTFALDGSNTMTPNANFVGSSTITPFGNGWYRCTITSTTGAVIGGNLADIGCSTNAGNLTGTVGAFIYCYGAQLEAGSFATSYIPTTTLAVLRNADGVSMTGTNFSSWYNATEGAFIFWGDQNAVSAEIGYFAEARTDNSNRIQMFANNGGGQNQLTVRNGGSIQADFTNSGTVTQGTAFKTSFAYKLDSFGLARDGGTVATDTLGTIPSVTDLLIGHSGAASNLQLNGHIAKILYYPQRIINAEVQAFSK